MQYTDYVGLDAGFRKIQFHCDVAFNEALANQTCMFCRSWLDHVILRELETVILGCSKYRMTVFTLQGSRAIRCKLDQGLVHSAHTAAMACTTRCHLFLSLSVGDQNFCGKHQ
jgi:hypothetical protein